jgi:hypothetical protein
MLKDKNKNKFNSPEFDNTKSILWKYYFAPIFALTGLQCEAKKILLYCSNLKWNEALMSISLYIYNDNVGFI